MGGGSRDLRGDETEHSGGGASRNAGKAGSGDRPYGRASAGRHLGRRNVGREEGRRYSKVVRRKKKGGNRQGHHR